MTSKSILITGGTGLVGKKLTQQLLARRYQDVRILTRSATRHKKTHPSLQFFEWNPLAKYIDVEAFHDVNIVIHLAGDNIATGRWTKQKKENIRRSRVEASRFLVNSIRDHGTKVSQLISASAIGFYGDRGEENLDETSCKGLGFLADVCHDWEHEVLGLRSDRIKTNILRFGVVLSKEGGFLSKVVPVFKAGFGGKVGNGSQYISWIHIDDLIHQIIWLIDHQPDQSILNAVSPNPVTNIEFTNILKRIVRRPAFLPVPKFALKALLGEMSELALSSQKVHPKRFMNLDFQWTHPDLPSALSHIFDKDLS